MSKYTIERARGCVLIIGAVPVNEFVALVALWGRPDEEWIADALLAQALGTSFVLGPRVACQAWRDEIYAGRARVTHQADPDKDKP